MLVENRSDLTGKVTSRELNITQEQLDRWYAGEKIQNVFPHLSNGDREFLMTGVTEEEWDSVFPEEDEEDVAEDYWEFKMSEQID